MTEDPLKNPSDGWGAPEYDGRRADRVGRILMFVLGAAVLVGVGILIGGMLAGRYRERDEYAGSRYASETTAQVDADGAVVGELRSLSGFERRAALMRKTRDLAHELQQYAEDHDGEFPKLTDEDLRRFSSDDGKPLSNEELKEIIRKSLVDVDDVRRPDGITSDGPPAPPAGGNWQEYVTALREAGLDVVIVFDSTGSMGGIILQLKTRIREYADVVKSIVPDARVGCVTYRDRKKYDLEDYEYTVKYQNLVALDDDGIGKLRRFLRECEAFGGGDIPEAVYEGVEVAIQKNAWRPGARKVMIVIGDAPPRPENNGIGKTYGLAGTWHDTTGGVVSCIDTTGDGSLLHEFKKLAAEGGGESVALDDEKEVIRQALLFTLGSKWAAEIDKVRAGRKE